MQSKTAKGKREWPSREHSLGDTFDLRDILNTISSTRKIHFHKTSSRRCPEDDAKDDSSLAEFRPSELASIIFGFYARF
jgi:hypothetical protein